MALFQDFHRIGLFGMSYAGLDEAFRLGLLQSRGGRRKWLFHDMGHSVEEVCTLIQFEHHQSCSLYIGHVGATEVEEALRATGKPVLNIAGNLSVEGWETYGLDYAAMGRTAAEYFHEAGFRYFLYVTGYPVPSDYQKRKAFVRTLRSKGHDQIYTFDHSPEKTVTQFGETEIVRPLESMVEWIAAAPKPLAIFCGTDRKARELMDFVHFRGVQIPEEVAFLGCDNSATFCEMLLVPLSSIALPASRVGSLVGDHADAVLSGARRPALKRLSPERVVVRASSDLVAIEDPVVAKAVSLMRMHAHERITIEAITHELPVSRRRFSERFREALHRSPLEELARIRVRLAKDRLLDTDQTMFHIAMDCGFADAESMAREFKRWEGMTPNAYRKLHRQR